MKQLGEDRHTGTDDHEEEDGQDLRRSGDPELVDGVQAEEVDGGDREDARHHARHEPTEPGGGDHRGKEGEEGQVHVPQGIEGDTDEGGDDDAADRDEITSHETRQPSEGEAGAQAEVGPVNVKNTTGTQAGSGVDDASSGP